MDNLHFGTMLALVAGFAFAASITESVGMFTHEHIGFGLLFRHGRKGWLALPLLVMTGPVVVLRAVVRLGPRRRWPLGVVVGGMALALGWSVASGHLLLRFVGWINGGW